ncbi:hypothetical protein [Mucilaginibacter sp. BT774]|uniref:hypothetical protein n=1 Tax=Mucilaginibacter sp. BT774 TaxID=3062276 RepID=UPI00267579AC|nr:hypothetical protein [Mucilaginibacter sp. BT774]MDO3626974.1 hypothetical protein [Mucilaginibacter sp. BT774]
MSSTEHANDERHYILITIAIAIGLVGVYLRFAGDAPYYSWIANVILIIGVGIALKGVFAILK